MAKSLDPSSIVVAPAAGGVVSPFDCGIGPVDDNDNHDSYNPHDPWDDHDRPNC